MHLYKTQNIFFDGVFDQISLKSLDDVFRTFDRKMSVHNAPIYQDLKKEHAQHGFSIVEGVLVCHAQSNALSSRQTFFMRLNQVFSVNGHPIHFIACTLSPARLGILNLRYLSRLTRFFKNKSLIEDLESVESLDGLKIILNGEDALVRDLVA